MPKTNNNMQELQFLEQNLQNILLQKQAFELELSETESAIKETESSDGEVFKLIGQIMVKSNKESILEELTNKKKFLELRLKNFENQEKTFSEKIESLRKKILDKDKQKK